MFGPLALPRVDTARQGTDHPFVAAHAPDTSGAGVGCFVVFVCHGSPSKTKEGQPPGCLSILHDTNFSLKYTGTVPTFSPNPHAVPHFPGILCGGGKIPAC